MTIPATIDDVTAPWLAEATGLDITGVESEIIGVGIGVTSAVYRLTLTGNDVPDTLVLKLNALDEAAVVNGTMLRLYEREVKYFQGLCDRTPLHTPRGYGGQIESDGSKYYVLMEDMGEHRVVDQNEGMSLADAERSIDALARWHAEFWGDADQYVESGAAVCLADDLYKAVLPVVFADGWEKIEREMTVHPTVAAVAPRWVDALPSLLETLSTAPTTVVHGDYRADNILFDDDDELVLLDFQITGRATPAYDVAYFVTQSLTPELASAHERELFDRYVAGLIAAGVPAEETAALWESYRASALFCLVYPVVAARGMDLSDDRQRELIQSMTTRCARALDELDAAALL